MSGTGTALCNVWYWHSAMQCGALRSCMVLPASGPRSGGSWEVPLAIEMQLFFFFCFVMLSSYASAMPCSVLTCRMVLPGESGSRYKTNGHTLIVVGLGYLCRNVDMTHTCDEGETRAYLYWNKRVGKTCDAYVDHTRML
eukprot:2186539-Rhodomonas_salina.2